VSDLRRAGIALRVRWEVQARAEGRLELRSSEREVVAVFQAATTIHLGDAKSTDNWLMGSCPMRIAPTVFASVGARKRKATVADALTNNEWVRHFTGATTMRALLEIGNLCDLIDGSNCRRSPTLSPGGLHLINATRRRRPMAPCSSARRRHLTRSKFGRRRLRRGSNSSIRPRSLPMQTQNISSSTHHIESLDICMKH
jgi:hypothetical protein